METIDRVAELMITIEEFSELLAEETAAIRVANAKAVGSLLERKQFLATHYTRQLQTMCDRKEGLKELDPSVKAMLTKSWQKFNERVKENAATLEVAQRATRQVVDIIVQAIKETQGAQVGQGYGGAYGSSAEAGRSTASSFVSVALNKVL
jgi:hypothetical protein